MMKGLCQSLFVKLEACVIFILSFAKQKELTASSTPHPLLSVITVILVLEVLLHLVHQEYEMWEISHKLDL